MDKMNCKHRGPPDLRFGGCSIGVDVHYSSAKREKRRGSQRARLRNLETGRLARRGSASSKGDEVTDRDGWWGSQVGKLLRVSYTLEEQGVEDPGAPLTSEVLAHKWPAWRPDPMLMAMVGPVAAGSGAG